MKPLEIVLLVIGVIIWGWMAVAGATVARVKGKSYMGYLLAGIVAPGIPFIVAIMSKNTTPIPKMLERLDAQLEKVEKKHAEGKLSDEKYESEKKSTETSIEKLEWAIGQGAVTVYDAAVLIQTGKLPGQEEAAAPEEAPEGEAPETGEPEEAKQLEAGEPEEKQEKADEGPVNE